MRLLLLQDLLVLPLDLLHDHLPLLGYLLLKVVLSEEVIQLLQNSLDKREISHLETPANGQAVVFLTGLLEVFISEISFEFVEDDDHDDVDLDDRDDCDDHDDHDDHDGANYDE